MCPRMVESLDPHKAASLGEGSCGQVIILLKVIDRKCFPDPVWAEKQRN